MHSMKRRGTARALTTEALAVRKALGWKLGSPDPRRGGAVIQQRVREYYSHIATLIPQRDWTAKAAAAFLNSAGYKTINGAQFSHTTVLRLWSRVSDGIF